MNHLKIDQYAHVDQECPVSVDMCPADDFVEIVLGDDRFSGVAVRLIVDHPDTFLRLTEALHDGHTKLVEHLGTKLAAPVAH